MPLVEVTLVAGRTSEQLRTLIHEVHEAIVHALEADPAAVRVVLREVPPEHWAAGDQTIAERRAATAP
jgi:4-oxalocrotonate tautomerase